MIDIFFTSSYGWLPLKATLKRKGKKRKTRHFALPLVLSHHHVVGWLVVGGGSVSMFVDTNGERLSATKLNALSPPLWTPKAKDCSLLYFLWMHLNATWSLMFSLFLFIWMCKRTFCNLVDFFARENDIVKCWYFIACNCRSISCGLEISQLHVYILGIFTINDDLHVDLVNLQILWCIICKSEQTSNDVLAQKSIMHKCLIKYIRINGITLVIIHVQITHPKLFVMKKYISKCVLIHFGFH